MKKLTVALAAIFASVCAFAQTITLDSGYSQPAQPILSVDYGVVGLDLDSSGNLYFLGGDPGADFEQSQVIEATSASSYASLTPIVQYPSPTYGSFVTVQGSTVYYGDSSNINSVSLPVATAAAPVPIISMASNYDVEFSGNTPFFSADPSYTDNEVYTLDLSSSTYTPVMDTGGDYSGPIALDSKGDLIYGSTGLSGPAGGIYLFSAALLQGAITSGSALQISQGQLIASDSGNSSLAMGPNDVLYDAFSPYAGAYATVTAYDLDTGAATPVGQVNNQGDAISGLRYYNGDIYIAETDGENATNFIEITPAPVPEPGVIPLVLSSFILAGAFLFSRRAGKIRTS